MGNSHRHAAQLINGIYFVTYMGIQVENVNGNDLFLNNLSDELFNLNWGKTVYNFCLFYNTSVRL